MKIHSTWRHNNRFPERKKSCEFENQKTRTKWIGSRLVQFIQNETYCRLQKQFYYYFPLFLFYNYYCSRWDNHFYIKNYQLCTWNIFSETIPWKYWLSFNFYILSSYHSVFICISHWIESSFSKYWIPILASIIFESIKSKSSEKQKIRNKEMNFLYILSVEKIARKCVELFSNGSTHNNIFIGANQNRNSNNNDNKNIEAKAANATRCIASFCNFFYKI